MFPALSGVISCSDDQLCLASCMSLSRQTRHTGPPGPFSVYAMDKVTSELSFSGTSPTEKHLFCAPSQKLLAQWLDIFDLLLLPVPPPISPSKQEISRSMSSPDSPGNEEHLYITSDDCKWNVYRKGFENFKGIVLLKIYKLYFFHNAFIDYFRWNRSKQCIVYSAFVISSKRIRK